MRRLFRLTGVAVKKCPESHGVLMQNRLGAGLHVAQAASVLELDPPNFQES